MLLYPLTLWVTAYDGALIGVLRFEMLAALQDLTLL
jgi:hypothetical protein